MKNYVIGDSHCDTISGMYRSVNLYKSDAHIDIKRMKKYKNYLQFFAIWFHDTFNIQTAEEKYCAILNTFYRQIELNKDYICHVKSADDIDNAFESNKIAAFLCLEGTGVIGDDSDKIDILADDGISLITLTWNHNNPLASAAMDKDPGYGLTPLGMQAIKKLNDKKIIIDVSHMSEKGFWDVAKTSTMPFAATHSNSKYICNHPRNLSDEQFKFLAKNGGYTGINFYKEFLSENKKASIDDIIRHIDRFLELGGEDCIGIGSDFDGCDMLPTGIDGCQDMHKLADRLSALYGDKIAYKICFENLYNFIKRTTI